MLTRKRGTELFGLEGLGELEECLNLIDRKFLLRVQLYEPDTSGKNGVSSDLIV